MGETKTFAEGLSAYCNRCPYCGQWIAVECDDVNGNKLVRHKPYGGHKDGPNCIGSGYRAPYLGDIDPPRSVPAEWVRE
jgi:hypothetical protein